MAGKSVLNYGIKPKFKLIRVFMVVLVTCKNEGTRVKALEWSKHMSDYKSMGILADAQWHSLLPARMKKIQAQMKALEWLQHYKSFFSDTKGQLTQ